MSNYTSLHKGARIVCWNFRGTNDWLGELLHNSVKQLTDIPTEMAYDLIDHFMGNDYMIDYIEVYNIGSHDFVTYTDEATDMIWSDDLSGLSTNTIDSIKESYEDLFDEIPDMSKVSDWLFYFLMAHSEMVSGIRD